MEVDKYRCEATTVEGFIQQLAVSYLPHGYWFYVTGWMPKGKDPRTVDRKLIERYQIHLSKWARARQKQVGHAGIQYLRHGRFFVLLATHGKHAFFKDEAKNIRDARHVPIKYHGYAVSFRGGHSHVRIEQRHYLRLKAYLLEIAVHRNLDGVVKEFQRVPFEPYAPVRRQLLNILRAVNKVRRAAGFNLVGFETLRYRRRIVKPFGETRLEVADGRDSQISETVSDASPPRRSCSLPK